MMIYIILGIYPLLVWEKILKILYHHEKHHVMMVVTTFGLQRSIFNQFRQTGA